MTGHRSNRCGGLLPISSSATAGLCCSHHSPALVTRASPSPPCCLPTLTLTLLSQVASYYHDVPYHNFNHAVHVLHCTWMVSQGSWGAWKGPHNASLTIHQCPSLPASPTHSLAPCPSAVSPSQLMSTPSASAVLSMEDKLAILIAALCHDLDHDGRSNGFHMNTQV